MKELEIHNLKILSSDKLKTPARIQQAGVFCALVP